MNIFILENKESNTTQAKHVFQSSKESENVNFYIIKQIYKKTNQYAEKMDFTEGLTLAYKYVLNQMPMNVRIDTQLKHRNSSINDKIDIIVDNIRTNNLYNNMVK